MHTKFAVCMSVHRTASCSGMGGALTGGGWSFFIPHSQQYVLQLLGSYATFMALLLILVMGVLPPESRSSTVGYCMVAFTVIMFGAPMASLVGPDIDPRTGLPLFSSCLLVMSSDVE